MIIIVKYVIIILKTCDEDNLLMWLLYNNTTHAHEVTCPPLEINSFLYHNYVLRSMLIKPQNLYHQHLPEESG